MATIVTRAGKGSPLTNAELDANFVNLNVELGTKADASSLAGYQPLDGDLTAIAGLSGQVGLLRKNADNTWAIDTAAYLTGITAAQVTAALGYTPYNATNPSGYISGINSSMVTTALGFTPYNSSNPAGYISGINSGMVTTALGYTPANRAGDTFTGAVTFSGGINPNAVFKAEGGAEGGQFLLEKGSTGTTLSGNLVVDLVGDVIRFFEGGGTNRGAFLNIMSQGTGAGSRILTDTTLTSGNVTTALGYTPANKAGDTFTGNVGIGHSPSFPLDINGNARSVIGNSYFCYTADYGMGTPDFNGLQIFASNGDTLRFGHRTLGTTFTERMRIESGGNVTANVDFRAPIFVDSQNSAFFVDPNSVTNINRITASGRSLVGNATIDMSGLDQNTYYPVTIPLPVARRTTLRIENALNSNAPSWSTHPAGFSCYVEWVSNGFGWGTINVDRYIVNWREGFANAPIVGGFTLLGNSSQEVIWLRGGGTYYFSADCDVTPTIRTTTYESLGQTVAPRSTVFNNPYDAATGRAAFGEVSTTFRVSSSGDMRAPIFLDSNDTSYYLDPNGVSVLNAINVWGEIGPRRNDVQSLLRSYNLSAGGPLQFYLDHNFGNVNIGNSRGVVFAGGSYWEIANSVRSPIFYDSDNTGFYLDPTGFSFLGTVSLGPQTWRSDITWNNGVNIIVPAGESSFDVSSGGLWHVWDSTAGNSMIYAAAGAQVQIGAAGSRGLYVYGGITASSNVTAYSDIRVKDNVEQIGGALDRLQAIRGVTYTRNDLEDKERRYAGVIAQEIEAVLPEAVFDSGDKKSVDYNATIGLLIEAIKELKTEVETLKKEYH